MEREVEIVPWFHSYYAGQEHGRIIDYIKSLPKNSFLALEKTPPATAPESIFQFSVNFELDDALLECRKRNITVISLEAAHLIKEYERALTEKNHYRIALIGSQRERLSAERISSSFKQFGIKKLVVVVGAAHAIPIIKELEKKQVKGRLNTSIYSTESNELLRRLFHLVEEQKRALAEKNIPKISRINEEMDNLAAMGHRIKEHSAIDNPKVEFATRLSQKVWNRMKNQKARLQRKILKRRSLK